jgi:anaerobic ribonucleoside-triphosphate reductase activating protein
MRVAGIVKESLTNGPGVRAVVFFQGCKHYCEGCQNPSTWDPSGGTEMPILDVWNEVYSPHINGITLSGGDPLYQVGPATLLAMMGRTWGLNVWLYTGFTLEEIAEMDDWHIRHLLEYVDVLVDGPFIEEKKDLSLPYRGSSNQRVIVQPYKQMQDYITKGVPIRHDNSF